MNRVITKTEEWLDRSLGLWHRKDIQFNDLVNYDTHPYQSQSAYSLSKEIVNDEPIYTYRIGTLNIVDKEKEITVIHLTLSEDGNTVFYKKDFENLTYRGSLIQRSVSHLHNNSIRLISTINRTTNIEILSLYNDDKEMIHTVYYLDVETGGIRGCGSSRQKKVDLEKEKNNIEWAGWI